MGNLLRNKWLIAILVLTCVALAGGYFLLGPDSSDKTRAIVLERAKVARPDAKSAAREEQAEGEQKTAEAQTPAAAAAAADTGPKREEVGTVVQFKGLVFAETDKVKRTLSENDPLFKGDRIVTGTEGRIVMKMKDKAVIALGPESEFLVQEYQYSMKDQSGNGALDMTKGMIKFTSGRLAQLQNRPFKVTTPSATLGVRGTEGFARLGNGGKIDVITLKKEVLVWMEERLASGKSASLGEVYFSPGWSLFREAFAADTSKDPQIVKQNEILQGTPGDKTEVRKATREELKTSHTATAVRKLTPETQQQLIKQAAQDLVDKGAAKDVAAAEKMLAKNPEAMKEVFDKAEKKLEEDLSKAVDKKLDQNEKLDKVEEKLKKELGEDAYKKLKAAEAERDKKEEQAQRKAEEKLLKTLGDEKKVEAALEIEEQKQQKKETAATEAAEKLEKTLGPETAEKLHLIEAEKEKKTLQLANETEKSLQDNLGQEKKEKITSILAEKNAKPGELTQETLKALQDALPNEKDFQKAKEILLKQAADAAALTKKTAEQIAAAVPADKATQAQEILNQKAQQTNNAEREAATQMRNILPPEALAQFKAIKAETQQQQQIIQAETNKQIQAVVPTEKQAIFQTIQQEKEKIKLQPTIDLSKIDTSKAGDHHQSEAVKSSETALKQFTTLLVEAVKSGTPLEKAIEKKAEDVKTVQKQEATKLGLNVEEANKAASKVKQEQVQETTKKTATETKPPTDDKTTTDTKPTGDDTNKKDDKSTVPDTGKPPTDKPPVSPTTTIPTVTTSIPSTTPGGLPEAVSSKPATATSTTTSTILQSNRPPTVNAQTFTLKENSPNGTIVGTLSATDPDPADKGALSFSLSGTGSTAFAIDAASGTITVSDVAQMNYEVNKSFALSVTVKDPKGTTGTATVTINLTDVNEPPTATNLAANEAFAEDAAAFKLVPIVVSDPDAGGTLTATLTLSDASAGTLSADSSPAGISSSFSAGTWRASGSLDDINFLLAAVKFTPAANYDKNFTITTSVNDGATTLSGSKPVTVTPVNDAPTATNLSAAEAFTEDAKAFKLKAIEVNDNDANAVLTVTLSLSDPLAGTLAVASAGNTTSSFADGVWSASGPQADINALLAALTFTPAKDYDLSFSIATSVSDGIAPALTGTKIVTVTPVNDAPVAVNDTGSATEAGGSNNATAGSAASGNVLTNDTDVEGDTLTVTAIRLGSTEGSGSAGTLASPLIGTYGSLTMQEDGSYSYTVDDTNPTVQALNSAQSITDTFNYTVTDGALTDIGLLTITINGANDTPVASDDTGSATEASGTANGTAGSNATGNLLTNDTDPDDGTTLQVSAIRTGGVEGSGTAGTVGAALTGTYGALTVAAGGTYTYVIDESNATVQALAPGQTLSESFNYTVTDGTLTDMAVLAVTINGANDAPVAVNDTGSATEAGGVNNATPGTNATGNVLDNDTDVDTSHASLTVSAFRLGASEGLGTAATPGATLVGTYGSLTMATDGSYTYVIDNTNATVNALAVGQSITESFNYTASDGSLSDIGVLTITINGANENPVAANDTGTATEAGGTLNGTAGTQATGNVLTSSDTDADTGTTLTVAAIRTGNTEGSGTAGTVGAALTGTYGSLTIASTGAYTYTVDESNVTVQALQSGQSLTEYYNYTASDGSLTDTALLTITINGTNDAPVAVNDTASATEKGGTNNGTAGANATGNVLTNDTDVESNALSVTSLRTGNVEGSGTAATASGADYVSTGTYGTLTLTPATGVFTYVVDDTNAVVQALKSGQSTTDSFNYTVSDGALTDIGVLTVTINGANDAPTITSATTASFAENGTGTAYAATATDPESDAITWSFAGTGADESKFDITAGGVVTFKTAPNYEVPTDANTDNVYEVTMVATDNGSGSLTASQAVSISVTNVNDAPVITAPSAASLTALATEDTALAVSFSVADEDDSGGTMQASLSVTNGTMTLGGGSGVSITSGANGSASMVFTGTKTQLNTALTGMSYQGSANYNGSETITLSISDQGNTGAGGAQSATATVTFTIAAVNDTPTITTPTTPSVSEDVAATIVGWSVADVDMTVPTNTIASNPIQVTLSATKGKLTLSTTTGLSFSSGANNSSSMVFTGTVTDVNTALTGLSYLSNSNANGAETVTLTVSDQGSIGSGGALSANSTLNFTIVAVNDAPTVTVPTGLSATEDTSMTITGVSVADVDAGTNPVEITLTATIGKVTLASTTGLTFTSGANNASSMVFTGTLTNVNTALATLTYLGNQDANGAETVTVTINDQGYVGDESPVVPKNATGTMTFTVAAVNDAPVISGTAAPTAAVTEDTAATITGWSVADVDAAAGTMQATLTALHGKVTVTNGSVSLTTANNLSTVIFTGTLANLSAAIGSFTYQGDQDYNGSETVSVTVSDMGFTGSGGAKTASTSITFSVAAVSDAPTDLTLSGTSFYEDADPGSVIATITPTDPDINNPSDTFTYAITTDASSLFAVRSNASGAYLTVRTGATPVAGSYSVTIQVTDSGSNTFSKSFTITVVARPFSLDSAADVPNAATIKSNAETLFKSILSTMNANPSSKVLTNSDIVTLILGKLGQQFTTGGAFTNAVNEVVKRLTVEILPADDPTVIRIMARIGLIEGMYNRLPASVAAVFDSVFNTFAPFATDYTTDVRIRLKPSVDNTAKTIGIDVANSTVEVLHLEMLPNISMNLSTLLSSYNGALTLLKTDGSLAFFTGGGGMGPTPHVLGSTLGLTPSNALDRHNALKATAQANGVTDQFSANSKTIPTSIRFDYYLPGMINSIAFSTGTVTLTR
ncbi:MAG: cadherin domain-containing protein [Magnetococcales bacterium]|nr:cadherin domain-containing protein [Magnetococcales bacterium]